MKLRRTKKIVPFLGHPVGLISLLFVRSLGLNQPPKQASARPILWGCDVQVSELMVRRMDLLHCRGTFIVTQHSCFTAKFDTSKYLTPPSSLYVILRVRASLSRYCTNVTEGYCQADEARCTYGSDRFDWLIDWLIDADGHVFVIRYRYVRDWTLPAAAAHSTPITSLSDKARKTTKNF